MYAGGVDMLTDVTGNLYNYQAVPEEVVSCDQTNCLPPIKINKDKENETIGEKEKENKSKVTKNYYYYPALEYVAKDFESIDAVQAYDIPQSLLDDVLKFDNKDKRFRVKLAMVLLIDLLLLVSLFVVMRRKDVIR